MNIAQSMLQELEQEAAATRRVLERVPNDKLSWKPAAKSRSLGELAQHIAENPGSVCFMLTHNPASPPGANKATEMPASAAELLVTLDRSLAQARSILSGWSDAAMMETVRMTAGGQDLMALPRAAWARMVLLNHWYHHRGQLSVYLRLLDVPVPSIYGPSADENPFARG